MSEQPRTQTKTTPFHLVVIGAGASGLACAIRMAQVLDAQNSRDAARIEVYEASRKIGHSILASGNGRCNYSNTKIYDGDGVAAEDQFYMHVSFVNQVRTICCEQCAPAPEWLSALGLLGREAKSHDGMLFPVSNQASSVLDTLLSWCEAYGIAVMSQTRVDALTRTPDGRFSLSGTRSVPLDTGMHERSGSKKKKAKKPQYQEVPFTRSADAVVLAIGRALADTPQLALDHPYTPMLSVLGPLRATISDVPDAVQSNKALDGVRQQVKLRVLSQETHRPLFSETGEVLFRPYGISGIVVFNASRFAAPGDTLELDLLPDVSEETFAAHLLQTLEARANVEQETLADMIDALLTGVFVAPLRALLVTCVCALLQAEGMALDVAPGAMHDAAHAICERIAYASKHVMLEVEGIATDQTCQVMRGGCAVSDIDPATCESRVVPSFYITGEALDVDGPCGGFNLDWAWTSGIVAGEALAHEVLQRQAKESRL